MPTSEEVAGSLDQIMSVTAIWGRSSEPVMCFGSRGHEGLKNPGCFQKARVIAVKAILRPYLVLFGGSAEFSKELSGRVLELVRVTAAYGEIKAFVPDPTLMTRLAQWPVAVVLSEVCRIEVEPRLIEDLDFADKNILANAYDGVRRDEASLMQLWDTLRSVEVMRRWDVEPLPDFRDPGKVQLCGSRYPKVPAGSSEGKRIRKEMVDKEHDPKLARSVEEINRALNVESLPAKAVILATNAAHCLTPTIEIRSKKGRAGVARRVLRCSVRRVIAGVIIRLLMFFSPLQFSR